MILVTRPVAIPAAISGNGAAETFINNGKYLADIIGYNNGTSKFKIKSSIYNATGVKSSLKLAQHHKCCFCEKHQADENGAVEHYRPKGGYQLFRKDKLKKPGYYWQGYEWTNLLFVCETCNKKKGNIFPLQVEANRALEHRMPISAEDPMLLNPVGPKDPRLHIEFDNQFIRGVTDEGRETIGICKLDRDGLNEERLKVLTELQERVAIILDNRDADAVSRASVYLKKSILPTAAFSAMAQDYIAKSPIVIT